MSSGEAYDRDTGEMIAMILYDCEKTDAIGEQRKT